MNTKNSRLYTKVYKGWVLLGGILLILSALTGCKGPSDSEGGTPVVTHYHVSMTDAQNGTLTAVPAIPSDGKVLKNTEIEFTAAPNPTYEVRSWEISGGQKISGGDPGDVKAKIKVTSDVTVSVIIGKEYTKVAYGDLATHLASASSTEVNYIEITGTIPAADLKGSLNAMTSEFEMGALATKLQTPPGKKIALKLPETVTGITSMTYCFKDCTNLVSLMNIPSSVTDMNGCFSGCAELTDVSAIPSGVTDLQDCFSGCIKLVSAPAVPESVTAMAWCFKGCTNLTKVPTVPQNVTAIKECFEGCIKLSSVTLKCNYNPALMGPNPSFYHAFNNCPALDAGSITVPKGTLSAYTAAASVMGTTEDKFKEAAD